MRTYLEEELAKGFIVPFHPSLLCLLDSSLSRREPCIDYRGLNDITVKFRYPLLLVPPAIEQLRFISLSSTYAMLTI